MASFLSLVVDDGLLDSAAQQYRRGSWSSENRYRLSAISSKPCGRNMALGPSTLSALQGGNQVHRRASRTASQPPPVRFPWLASTSDTLRRAREWRPPTPRCVGATSPWRGNAKGCPLVEPDRVPRSMIPLAHAPGVPKPSRHIWWSSRTFWTSWYIGLIFGPVSPVNNLRNLR